MSSRSILLSAVVPTLGFSPLLVDCLQALRREGKEQLEILLVAQGETLPETVTRLADEVIVLPENTGFAAANNRAFKQAKGSFIATINDDVIVEAGWLEPLLAALKEEPSIAAVQGTNLMFNAPHLVDGCGLAWNPSWQAVQMGRGQSLEQDLPPKNEIFGVSATAAIYRRSALESVAGPTIQAFDERLFAYYEDVDLAVRLRAAGYRALWVPQARVLHLGSSTGKRLRWSSRQLIYGNRYLVLSRLLGRVFWLYLPRILLRDLIDFARAALRLDTAVCLGILAGGGRALRRIWAFVHGGAPAVAVAKLRGFRQP